MFCVWEVANTQVPYSEPITKRTALVVFGISWKLPSDQMDYSCRKTSYEIYLKCQNLKNSAFFQHLKRTENKSLNKISLHRLLTFFFFWDRVSLCSPGCPRSHFVDLAGPELKRSACFCLLVLSFRHVAPCLLLYRFWRSELRPSCLWGKHFTHFAFPNPYFSFVLKN